MKYTVLSNLKHNGEDFTRGDVIDLTKDVAEPLVRASVLSADKTPVVKEKDWKKGPDPIIPAPDAEIDSAGNAPEKEEDEEETSDEDNTEQESKIAGAQDDTSKIDEDADKDL